MSVPLATIRDASIIKPNEHRVEVAFSEAASDVHGKDIDSEIGGPHLEVAYRTGVTTDVDKAFRLGLSTLGIIAGYERGWKQFVIGEHTNVITYGGVLGGAQLGNYFGQLYSGVIVGRGYGVLRPEVTLRLTGQPGYIYNGLYFLAVSTIEPRMRVRVWALDAMIGVGASLGYGQCSQCFVSFYEDDGEQTFYEYHALASVALTVDSPRK